MKCFGGFILGAAIGLILGAFYTVPREDVITMTKSWIQCVGKAVELSEEMRKNKCDATK